jgi:heme exporter protein D
MHWHDVSEFFAMGGRGAFVWGAYGTMALLMLVEVVLVRARHRAARRAIAERLADEAAARAAGAPQ